MAAPSTNSIVTTSPESVCARDFPAAIVSTFFDKVGGIASFIAGMYRESISRNDRIVFLSPNIRNPARKQTRIGGKGRLAQLLCTFAALRETKARYVQCHGAWYLQLGCILYKWTERVLGRRVRLTFVSHSVVDLSHRPLARRIFNALDNCADGHAFVSDYLLEYYTTNNKYRFESRPMVIELATSGADDRKPEDLKRIAEALEPIRARGIAIVTYIGLVFYEGKYRGARMLLDAVAKLLAAGHSLHLAVATGGDYFPQFMADIEKRNLGGRVTVFSDLMPAEGLLDYSALHCHISFQDAFPIVILEALRAGVPTLINDLGFGPRQDIDGLVRCPGNVDAIASCAAAMLAQAPRVDTEYVRRHYHRSKVYDEFVEFLYLG